MNQTNTVSAFWRTFLSHLSIVLDPGLTYDICAVGKEASFLEWECRHDEDADGP